MTFENAANEMIIASKQCEIGLIECDNVLENAIDDLSMFIKKAERKILMENGTEEDRVYLEEGATEGFLVKAKDVIMNIVDTLKEFFKKLRQKIISLFAEKDIDANLEKVEGKIKRNPFLKNKKVKTVDADKVDSCASEHCRNMNRLLAKAKSKGSVDTNEIADEENRFNKKWTIVTGASITLAATALIAIIRSKRKKIKEDIASVEDDVMDRIGDAKKSVENLTNPEDVAKLTRLCSSAAKAAKIRSESLLNNIVTMWLDLKKAITHSKESDKDIFDESVEEETDERCESDDKLDECGDFADEPDEPDDADAFVNAFNDLSGDDGEDIGIDDVDDSGVPEEDSIDDIDAPEDDDDSFMDIDIPIGEETLESEDTDDSFMDIDVPISDDFD